MKLIWTKSKLPLSIVIRSLTGDDCSHFAFVFESRASGLMFESNLLGTHPAFYQASVAPIGSHVIVHERSLPLTAEQEDAVWDLLVQKYDGKGYDFLGALYLGFWKLMKRILKCRLPAKNKWAQPGHYFCDEVYDVLNQIPGIPQIDVMNGMDTPHDVWIKLNEMERE